MSNHFNAGTSIRNNFQNKQNNQINFLKNQNTQKLRPENNFNPSTLIIKKSKKNNIFNLGNNQNIKMNNIKPQKKEEEKIVIKDNMTEQITNHKNISKKAKKSLKEPLEHPKTLIIHKVTNKSAHKSNILRNSLDSNKNGFIKNNNRNDDKINNCFKDDNNEINRYLQNKSEKKNYKKKNDFLKASININILDFEQSANEIEENNVKKLLDKNNNNNKKELYKISEENNSEFNPNLNQIQKEKIQKEKEKEKEKANSNKNSSNSNIEKLKRPLQKKHTFQSQITPAQEIKKFNLEKRNSLKLSCKELGAFRNSLRDGFLTKSNNSGKNSINNIIIPMLNKKKENNCFLNVIIQNLSHLENFKNDLSLSENTETFNKSKSINEFADIMKLYESEQIKNKDNKDTKIEPVLSVNNLRNELNQIYHRYKKGESGDPMETMNSIFDLIHEAYCIKKKIDKKEIKMCKCVAHKHFCLKLADIQLCPNCNSKKVQLYDKDCFMYNIYIKDLMNKLHGKSYNSFKLKLFQKLKEFNETYEENKKNKIPGCTCDERLMEFYQKKIKIMGPISTYLIINITWAEEFPSMNEILKTYAMLPVSEKINSLFSFDETIKNLINYTFSIKGIILYGIYHYVCALYIKDENRWAVIDDKTIKYIDKYFNLIDSFLRNHLMPVGLIYSKDENDALSESIINEMSLNKDEYTKLYLFCKDVDKRRGLKTSEIFQSKINFDESKGDYINNNLFFSIFDGQNDSKDTQKLINNIKILDKKDENKKDLDKNENKKIDKKENKQKDNIKLSGIFSFNRKSGVDMKGGIIDFGDNNEKESGNTKEDSDLLDIGNNYED
jgi:hypothetical protein